MTAQEFIAAVLSGYKTILESALPICFFIGACNVSFNIICSACFGGKLRFGGGHGD